MIEILAFFAAGLLLSFTPCVWPTIPIVGLLATKNSRLGLLTYILGSTITYALFGALAGYTGVALQPYLQSPIVLGVSSAIMIIMALIQFDVLRLNTVDLFSDFIYNKNIGPFFLGVFSSLVLSPCMTPTLAAILGYISSTGDLAKGFVLLFVLSLGINLPLVVAVVFGQRFLPKGGRWMKVVKIIIGVLFLATAVGLVLRTIPDNNTKSGYEAVRYASYGATYRESIAVTMYTASWCQACQDWKRSELPKLRAAGVPVNIIDVSSQFPKGIIGVPTILVYKNGKMAAKYVGGVSAENIIAIGTTDGSKKSR